MSEINKYAPPKKATAGDRVLAVTRAGLGAIPVGGNAATELLSAVVKSPHEKRMQKWMQDVADALVALEKNRGVNLEDLAARSDFRNAVAQAIKEAEKTLDEQALEALRNIIANTSLDFSTHRELQQFYFSHLDRLSSLHLRLLAFYDNPKKWLEDRQIEYQDILDEELEVLNLAIEFGYRWHAIMDRAFPEDQFGSDVLRQVHSDLAASGFLGGRDSYEVLAPATSPLGRKFLEYVMTPDFGEEASESE